jgi:hypothetical protein
MTAPGVRSDEWINTTDRLEWIHDGTTWQPRPFQDRLVGEKSGHVTTDKSYSGVFVQVPGASVDIVKARDNTDLLIFGIVSAFTHADWHKAEVAIHPASVVTPPSNEFDGQLYYVWKHGNFQIPFQKLLSGVSKGPQTLNLYARMINGSTLMTDSRDCFQITVWEVAHQ